jgi:hypothetical protein
MLLLPYETNNNVGMGKTKRGEEDEVQTKTQLTKSLTSLCIIWNDDKFIAIGLFWYYNKVSSFQPKTATFLDFFLLSVKNLWKKP